MAAATSGRSRGALSALLRGGGWAVKRAFGRLADLLTTLRLVATVPLVVLILEERYESAFWLFVFAGATDIADGLAARWLSEPTWFGALLDPVADKLFLGALFVLLGALLVLPVWLVALVVLRDISIGFGALILRLRLRRFRAEPLLVGKLCTLAQMLCIGFALGVLAGYVPSTPWLDLAVLAALVMTLFSGLVYLGMALRLERSAPA